ncbi:hypothetical protein QEZ47_18480 [Aminobacter anthyllidis]|nr:hypothetical protein [Aminobacter anthyllidis]MDH4987468.1 hypothetical protein [Aminobacter anthyllidis]
MPKSIGAPRKGGLANAVVLAAVNKDRKALAAAAGKGADAA